MQMTVGGILLLYKTDMQHQPSDHNKNHFFVW